MPVCIYCREEKPADEFNREHVVPQAFGSFKDNLVLHDLVCKDCNDYFGQHLDIVLARESTEGLERYEVGVKEAGAGTVLGHGSNLEARVVEDGVPGRLVVFTKAREGSGLGISKANQVGFSKRGENRFRWYAPGRIPTVTELEAEGFRLGNIDLRVVGGDDDVRDALYKELRDKGWQPEPPIGVEAVSLCEGGKTLVQTTVSLGQPLQRAVAKIGFNYLALHYPRIALMPEFASIARYIRHGKEIKPWPVTASDTPFVTGLQADAVAYAVGVAWTHGQVVAFVTLFFKVQYRIVLAAGGFAIPPEVISSAHMFDAISGRVVELTRSTE